MNHGIDIKKMRVNCFRQSKMAGELMLQVRVPGAMIEARHLSMVQELCERYDNETFHMGARQTLDVPGIRYENIEAVNRFLRGYIHDVDVEICDVDMEVDDCGCPTIGARNVMSCIGDAYCIRGSTNTYGLARKIEEIILPSHYHIKVTMARCPNDCIKANSNNFGIMDVSKQDYDIDRCIGCSLCVDTCKHHATGVLSLNKNGKVDRNACCYVGCRECSLICPTGAWTRRTRKLYRVTLGGKTGKQNPRTGKLFLNWMTEDMILGMFSNWQKFPAWTLDYKPEYLHGGHLVDWVDYKEFVEHIFEGMESNLKAKMTDDIFWAENKQEGSMHVMPLSEHKHAGPWGKK